MQGYNNKMSNESPAPRRKTRWVKPLIEVVIFLGLLAGFRAWQHRDMPSGPAPALAGAMLAGQAYKLPAHPGKPVLVHFWATWCGVCLAEQDTISAIAQNKDVDLITIAMQSGKKDEVARYVQKQHIDFNVINDEDGTLAARWGVNAVPADFVIAPDGTISFAEVGYTTHTGLRLRLWAAGL